MKFLHTSDWHVGRGIRGADRSLEQVAVLDELVALAAAEAVDAVLVAGDLFDTAAPSPEAERIVFEALLGLARTGATVVAIAGNHDSPRRLQAVQPLAALGNVVIRPFAMPAAAEGVVEVASRDGSERARVAVLPFLSQRQVVRAEQLMNLDAVEHREAYSSRVANIIGTLARQFSDETVNVVLAHATVVGGLLGGGERPAHTVFEYQVQARSFPANAQYVALGHLHRRQSLPGPCPIHYCGSPLQLDFGETDDIKATLVVEAFPGKPAEVRDVPVRAGRRLSTITGTVAELEALAAAPDPFLADAYLKVVVREAARVGLADEVRELFPNAVDVVVDHGSAGSATDQHRAVEGRPPRELFAAYLAEQGSHDSALLDHFSEILEQASSGDRAPEALP